jgi:hypothetical protein
MKRKSTDEDVTPEVVTTQEAIGATEAEPVNPMKELFDRINTTDKIANTSIESIDARMRPGWEVRIASAKEELELLVKELEHATIPTRLKGIFAGGDGQAVASTALYVEKSGGIVIDARKMYSDIAKNIEPSFGVQREFGTQQYAMLVTELRHLGNELELISNPKAPIMKDVLCPTFNDLVDHIRGSIFTTGESFNYKYIRKAVLKNVLDRGLYGKTLPVIVLNSTLQDCAELRPLFSDSINYKFPSNWEPTQGNIVALFRKGT